MQLPLEGVRVLDVSAAPGAYAARLLGDLGALVTKVEPPQGDRMRRLPPLRRGVTGPEASLRFATYHANKRGVTLDLGRERSLPLLEELAASCDVVVASPSRRDPLAGFDAETQRLSWAGDERVICFVTPFGLTGPYRDYRATSFTSFAMSGVMHRCGPPEHPIAVPGQQTWDEAGAHAALYVIAALHARPAVGGQTIDVSAHEVAAAKDYQFERYDVDGYDATWSRTAGVGFPPTGTWNCADGPFNVAAYQLHHWDAFLEMLGRPDALSEPSLADPVVRREIFDGLIDSIETLVAGRSRLDLFERGQKAGLPCNPVNTAAAFVADVQPNARGLFPAVDHPVLGRIRIPWGAVQSDPPIMSLRRAAPLLGQHNDEVYVGELGHSAGELARWKEEGLV